MGEVVRVQIGDLGAQATRRDGEGLVLSCVAIEWSVSRKVA